jgi:hypothetical protein
MSGKNFSCNNVEGKRKESDFYETPFSITRHLLNHEEFHGSILEPACGFGAITTVLTEHNYTHTAYDKETDFLKETKQYSNIITNPPYSLAFEFITKAKEVATNKFAMLLPLSYLHGKKRYDKIWTDIDYPLARVYIFTRYPMLGDPLRVDGKYRTGMMVYAWFVWDSKCWDEPTIRWIDNNMDVIGKGDV